MEARPELALGLMWLFTELAAPSPNRARRVMLLPG